MSEKTKHCLNVGLEGSIRLCMLPGMECVDAQCSGYDDCSDYTEGTRTISTSERLKHPIQHNFMVFKQGEKVKVSLLKPNNILNKKKEENDV